MITTSSNAMQVMTAGSTVVASPGIVFAPDWLA